MADTAGDGADDKVGRGEAGAQRILNLLFALGTARLPLSTDQIIGDSDLGYGSDNPDSDRKKFKRDREALAAQGIFVEEVHPEGMPENESSAWRIDQARTRVATESLQPGDGESLVAALDIYLAQGPAIPYRPIVRRIRAKVAEAVGEAPSPVPPDQPYRPDRDHEDRYDPIMESVWAARELQRALTFTYRDAKGAESQRTVEVYGLFTVDGACYFVGRDRGLDAVRTFRVDRVRTAKRPRGPYEIPSGFDISDYLFLPFDFSHGDPISATFSFPTQMGEAEIEGITHGRGELAPDGTGHTKWRIGVRSLEAAASFALGHASRGMRPVEPDELVTCWNNLIDKAVVRNGA